MQLTKTMSKDTLAHKIHKEIDAEFLLNNEGQRNSNVSRLNVDYQSTNSKIISRLRTKSTLKGSMKSIPMLTINSDHFCASMVKTHRKMPTVNLSKLSSKSRKFDDQDMKAS
jgi:hypothetical protein